MFVKDGFVICKKDLLDIYAHLNKIYLYKRNNERKNEGMKEITKDRNVSQTWSCFLIKMLPKYSQIYVMIMKDADVNEDWDLMV